MNDDTSQEPKVYETLEGNDVPPLLDQTSPSPQRAILHVNRRSAFIGLGACIVIALALVLIATLTNKSSPKANQSASSTSQAPQTQTLDQKTLSQLDAQSSSTDSQGRVVVNSSALFKSSLETQGQLKADQDLNVGGNTTIAGSTIMQGAVGLNSSLSVRGALSVGGALNAPTLNVGSLAVTNITVSSDLRIGGHLSPSGPSPTAHPSTASGGGTVVINGNDVSGTIDINTGTSGAPGELATVTFHTPYAIPPRVQLTPANAASASIQYYIARTASTFSVETGSNTTAGTTYVYDYLVTQ